MTKTGRINLAAIHIIDGICLTDATKFISTLLLSMTASIGMEMPMLNVINKINLLAEFPKLKFRLNDFLTSAGLEYILQAEEIAEKQRLESIAKFTKAPSSPTSSKSEYESIKSGFYLKYKGLNSKISELLDDYSNVSLVPFDLTDKRYMAYVVSLADKATGFNMAGKYSELELKLDYDSIVNYMSFEAAEDLQEKYLDKEDEY